MTSGYTRIYIHSTASKTMENEINKSRQHCHMANHAKRMSVYSIAAAPRPPLLSPPPHDKHTFNIHRETKPKI